MERYPENIELHRSLSQREAELQMQLDSVRAERRQLQSSDWGTIELLDNSLPDIARWVEYRISETPPEAKQRLPYHKPLMKTLANIQRYAGQAGMLMRTRHERGYRHPTDYHLFVLPEKPTVSADDCLEISLLDETLISSSFEEKSLRAIRVSSDELAASLPTGTTGWRTNENNFVWGTQAVINWTINNGKKAWLEPNYRGWPKQSVYFDKIFSFLAKHELLDTQSKRRLGSQAEKILRTVGPAYFEVEQSKERAYERAKQYKKQDGSAEARHLAEVILEDVVKEHHELRAEKLLWTSIATVVMNNRGFSSASEGQS